MDVHRDKRQQQQEKDIINSTRLKAPCLEGTSMAGQARPSGHITLTDGGCSNSMMATEIICTVNSISRRARRNNGNNPLNEAYCSQQHVMQFIHDL